MPRILTGAGILVALLAPALAFAAYNDVTLTTSAVFNVGGTALNVYTSSAVIQSATVNPTNMTLTLLPGSSATVSAPGKAAISQSGGSSYITVNECDNNASQIGFVYPAGAGSAVTITLTLPGTTCSGGSGGSSIATPVVTPASSGGGGGGSIATPATAATPATPAAPATPATPAAPAASASGLSTSQIQSILDVLTSFNVDADVIAKVKQSLQGTTATGSATSAAVGVFKTNLTAGSLGSEVKALQMFLNAHGYTIAKSGAGSPGKETTRFGAATKAALIKFQKAKGITPASGYFGAKTRAAINSGQ